MRSAIASALYHPNAVDVEAATLHCMTNRGGPMRPRVFVSSVMDGFEEYRRAAKEGIVGAGGEPVLVEDFSSLSQSPRTACLDAVASCDIYIAVVGSRGGWTAPSGQLVVEEEYEEARHRRLSILAFIQDTERDTDAQRLVRTLSDYIDGRFRKTFTAPAALQAEVGKALKPLIEHRARPEVDISVIEERLNTAPHIRNQASLRFVLAPERDEELIDPVSLDSEELKQQLFEIGHSPRVRLFAYERAKTSTVGPDDIVIFQTDESRHRDGIDEVRMELTSRGLLAIDMNVTGRAVSNLWDNSFGFLVIVEADVTTALEKSFAFAHEFFETRDPYRRYDRLLFNVALHSCQHRALVQKPPSGSFTVPQRYPDPDSVMAFDRSRVITRDDLSRSNEQIQATLALLRRRLK
jgi:hypothetical protein